MGAGMVIPGFEEGVRDMEEGDKKTIHIPAKEAYGEHREDMVMEFPRTHLPEGVDPQIGMQLQLQGPQGQAIPAKIIAVTEETLTLDANHPLAGQDLNFELELISKS
jgi:peptidylprolyl isomerase